MGGAQGLLSAAMAAMGEEKAKGRLNLKDMITHRIKLTVEDINAIFKEIDEKGTVVKSVMLLNQ